MRDELTLIVSGIDLSGYIDSFRLDMEPAVSESFVCYDGSEVSPSSGDYILMDVRVRRVPSRLYMRISAALAGEAEVTYNSPSPAAVKFRKTGFSANALNRGLTWDISFSLKSVAPVGGDCL